MKKIFSILVVLAMVLVGCENDGNDSGNSSAYLEIDRDILTFEDDGGDIIVQISSNAEWSIEEGDSWCKPSVSSGFGNALVTFTADANTSSDSRGTTFFVEYENYAIGITVEQDGFFIEDIVSYMDDSFFIKYCIDNFDLNNDGCISTNEAKNVRAINISNINEVRSIAGVEYFENLEIINCENTSITRADLSKNTKLNTLPDRAFNNCSQLQELHIPYSVKTFGESVFSKCKKLSKIYCETSWPPISDGSPFYGNSSLTDIYVPVTAVGVYNAYEYWENYNIIGYEYSTIIPTSAYDVDQWIGEYSAISDINMWYLEMDKSGNLSGGLVQHIGERYTYDFSIEKYKEPNVVELNNFMGHSGKSTIGFVEPSGNIRIPNGVMLDYDGQDYVWATLASSDAGLQAITGGTAYNLIFLPDGGYAIQYNHEEYKEYTYLIMGYDSSTKNVSLLLNPGEKQDYFTGTFAIERVTRTPLVTKSSKNGTYSLSSLWNNSVASDVIYDTWSLDNENYR